jgi:hypothetical protein
MSRYYFDLCNGDGPTNDNEGMELSSRESVTRQISRILVDIARDELPREERSVIEVKVRNEAGKVVSVASLTFSREWIE